MTKLLNCLLLFLIASAANAQQGNVVSGADAVGNAGSVTYTIGQVAYINAGNAAGSVTQGVQQPFEIAVVGINDFAGTNLSVIVYPNPTASSLNLSVEPLDAQKLYYHLFDVLGKEISSQKITQALTNIDISGVANATYFLEVSDSDSVLKTFQIILNK